MRWIYKLQILPIYVDPIQLGVPNWRVGLEKPEGAGGSFPGAPEISSLGRDRGGPGVFLMGPFF